MGASAQAPPELPETNVSRQAHTAFVTAMRLNGAPDSRFFDRRVPMKARVVLSLILFAVMAAVAAGARARGADAGPAGNRSADGNARSLPHLPTHCGAVP